MNIPMKEIQAVLFDLDGTLVDSISNTWAATASRCRITCKKRLKE